MPAHREFAQAFRQGLGTGRLPPGLTAPAPEEAARRFAVYRNNVAHGLIQALRARFPAIERLVGPEFFAAMAREFIRACPPDGPILQRWGGAMPSFLQEFPPVRGLPYLADIARIEIARGQAYHAADAEPVPPEKLRAAALKAPDTMRLHLHPSVRILHLACPGGAIWAAQQPGGPPPPPPEDWGPQSVLIARRGWHEVTVTVLAASDAAFTEAILAGKSFAQAVRKAQETGKKFDPVSALSSLLQAGLITGATVIQEGDQGCPT